MAGISDFIDKKKDIFSSSKLHIVFLTVLSVFLLFWDLGEGSISSGDEGIFAEVAKEILKTGDWVTLHKNYVVYNSKPPLYFWLTAVTYKVLGVSEFSARFWSATFGVGAVLVTYLLGRELFSKRVGFISAIILLTTPQFNNYWDYIFSDSARSASMDTTVTFFIALSILFFWLGRKDSRYLILSGISVGLGVMTKSVVGLIPVFIIFPFIIFSREFAIFRDKNLYKGVLAFLAVAAPWHIAQLIIYGKWFLDTYLFINVVERAAGNIGMANHDFFYITTVKYGFYPWSIFVIFAFLYIAKGAIESEKREGTLLLCWIGVVLLIFTHSTFKVPNYIMPIYPALSLSVARFFDRFIEGKREGLVFAGMFVSFVLWASLIPVVQFQPTWPRFGFNINDVNLIKGFVVGAVVFFALSMIERFRIRGTSYRKGASMLVVGVILASAIHMPVVSDYSHDVAKVASVMKEVSAPNARLGIYTKGVSAVSAFPIIFYSDRKGTWITNEKVLLRMLKSPNTFFAIDNLHHYLKIRTANTRMLARSGGLVLMTNDVSVPFIDETEIVIKAEIVEGIKLSKDRVRGGDKVDISYAIKNTGNDFAFEGDLYVHGNTKNLFSSSPGMSFKLKPNETVRFERTFTVSRSIPRGKYKARIAVRDTGLGIWVPLPYKNGNCANIEVLP